MRSSIRKIGNSKGIIIPHTFLKECFIDNEVTMEVKDNHIVISAPGKGVRKGWDEAFKAMAENGDDKLLIPDVFEDEQHDDWTW